MQGISIADTRSVLINSMASTKRGVCVGTRTRTNTNQNDTEANAAGRSVRACVARESKS